jgi:hypothetical protein
VAQAAQETHRQLALAKAATVEQAERLLPLTAVVAVAVPVLLVGTETELQAQQGTEGTEPHQALPVRL